jgi:diadenosine tetraphosphate (Ap4A) HIT family hydrolase
MVPQLHLHHVARYKNDISWPNPIWGNKPSTKYNKKNLKFRIESLVLAISRKGYNII